MTLLRGVYFFLVIRAADRIDEAFQGGAVDELHRDSPMSVPVFSQVINRDNGRMVQFRIQAAFFDKGTDRIGIILKAFVQALDCNHTVEHEIPRFGDPADASRAEIADILKTFGKVRGLHRFRITAGKSIFVTMSQCTCKNDCRINFSGRVSMSRACILIFHILTVPFQLF